MKPMWFFNKRCSLVFLLFLLLFSCKKKQEDEIIPAPDLSSEEEISIASADLNSIFNDLDLVLDSGINIPYTQITQKDSAVNKYSRVLTIQYLDTGSIYKIRSGTVKCFLAGKRVSGTHKDSVVFENTRINQRFIKGYFLTNQTSIADDSYTFEFRASVTSENSNGIPLSFVENRIKSKTGTNNNTVKGKFDLKDDIWNSTGSWIGKDSKGKFWTAETTAPLVIRRTCSDHYPIKGVVDFKTEGLSHRIKYGDGECDAKASYINSKGEEYTFQIQ